MKCVTWYLACAILVMPLVGCGGDDSSGPSRPSCEGESPGNATPPTGARFASLPWGAAIDLATGTIDEQGRTGDFRWQDHDMTGMTSAPCGISWWTGGSVADFTGWIANPGFLPPAGGWTEESTTEGSAGTSTRWVKISGGRYAMLFSVAVSECYFDFFYVAPYGPYTWTDTVRPAAPSITSVIPRATGGTLDVEWSPSSSPDVEGYWVSYGTDPRSRPALWAGATLTFSLTDLSHGVRYYVWVTAYDHEGNVSEYSAAATGTPL